MGEPSKKIPKIEPAEEEEKDPNKLVMINPPITKWTTIDHDEKCTFVFVAIAAIGGATQHTFQFNETGTQITVSFVWPKTMIIP